MIIKLTELSAFSPHVLLANRGKPRRPTRGTRANHGPEWGQSKNNNPLLMYAFDDSSNV